jgi:hypothetical protein
LLKKYEGVDGVGTKYIDPEELDGYSLYDVVTPPYDLETLADFMILVQFIMLLLMQEL